MRIKKIGERWKINYQPILKIEKSVLQQNPKVHTSWKLLRTFIQDRHQQVCIEVAQLKGEPIENAFYSIVIIHKKIYHYKTTAGGCLQGEITILQFVLEKK